MMLDELILYFVDQANGLMTKTQLVMFLYLVDLYAVKWTEKPLTQLDWYYFNHEPCADGIDLALNRLGMEIFQNTQYDFDLVRMSFRYSEMNCFNFSEGLRLVLENIRKEWTGLTSKRIQELSQYVHSTAPMIEGESKSSSESKARLNLKLARDQLIQELGL